MPSRRNNQDQSLDEQPGDEQLGDEQLADEPSIDAIAMLKEDHQRIKDLFAQYEATSNAEAKRTLAEQVFVEADLTSPVQYAGDHPTGSHFSNAGIKMRRGAGAGERL
jgi:hypothetical protein